MKKFFYLLFALLLFAGAVHAQTTDDSWWNDPFGQMDIELLNDEGQPVDSLAVWLSSTDVIYIGHKDPFYYQRLAMLGKHDPAMVVITRENNDTIFKKDLSKPSIQIQLNYLLIPSGEYALNVYWHDTWWRGEFAFK